MKIVKIIDGPYSDGTLIWLLCEVTDGRGCYWHEEIFYDCVEDAYEDMVDLDLSGIEVDEEDYLDEEEDQ